LTGSTLLDRYLIVLLYIMWDRGEDFGKKNIYNELFTDEVCTLIKNIY